MLYRWALKCSPSIHKVIILAAADQVRNGIMVFGRLFQVDGDSFGEGKFEETRAKSLLVFV